MSIGQRLVVAGLVDRAVLGQALAKASSQSMTLAEALVLSGVDPVALRQVACHATEAQPLAERELLPDSTQVAELLPASFCRRCLILPIRLAQGRLVVAAADPTDRHSLDEAARLTRRPLVVMGAETDALIQAIEDCYEEAALPEPRSAFAFSARRASGTGTENARAGRPSLLPPASPSGSYPLSGGSMEIPLDAGADSDSWSTGPTRPRRDKVAAVEVASGNARKPMDRDAARPIPRPAEDMGAVLATIRVAPTRDRVLEALLSAATTHARQAFCFRIRDGRLEGIDSAGSSLGAAAVRRIILPMSSASTFHRVIVDGQPHFGPLGLGATDQVLRVAIGSRGGRVSMHGLWIDSRPIGLLVADDVRTGQVGHERLGAYSHAASQTLRRLIADRS